MWYFKGHRTNAAINFIHNYPPAPPGFAPKNCLHPSFCPGAGICWDSSRGTGICQQTIFAISGIPIIMARTGNWQHFGVYLLLWNFICFKKIIQSWIETKLKMKMIFLIKDWECETVLLSRIWSWEYSEKSVCINNHIKEFVLFCWQLICGFLVFNNYKNSNYKKSWKESIKFEIFFFVKFQAPFSQKTINIHLDISYKAFMHSVVWLWWPPNDTYSDNQSSHWKTILFVRPQSFSFQIVLEVLDIFAKFSNLMSRE